jgi:hypothetical protein
MAMAQGPAEVELARQAVRPGLISAYRLLNEWAHTPHFEFPASRTGMLQDRTPDPTGAGQHAA